MSMPCPSRAFVVFSLFFTAATRAADPGSAVETIVISASPITSEDKLATLVETVDREEILRAGGASLADALANTPGVTGSAFAAGASRPVIRGLDSNRVRVLEDGIGSFDVAEVGPDHGIPIDPLSAQRIEVIRGAATLRYGSQAIGGVINAINNRVPARLPAEPFAAELTALYGSNADTRQGSALLDGRLGRFAWHADGFRRRSGDYDIPGGSMGNSFFDGYGHSVGGSYIGERHRAGGAVVRYDSEYGIPGEENFIDMRQAKELLRASFSPGIGAWHTLNVEGGHGDYEHHERDPLTGEAHATFTDDEWDARIEAILGEFGAFSAAAFGVHVQDREFAALGEARDYLLPTRTRSSAAFLFADVPIAGRLHLHAGARVEAVDIDGTPAGDVPTSRRFRPFSASAGLLFDASEVLRVGLTISSAARAPAQTELFARGPHEGSGTFETGDLSLGIERANSLEATLRQDAGRVSFEGALWTARFENYVFGALTGRRCDEEGDCTAADGDLDELEYRQGDARFHGAEAKAAFQVLEARQGALDIVVLADYVRARLRDGNVPRIPPYRVGAGLDWTHPAGAAGLILRYSGEQEHVAVAETPTRGFVSLDAQASWRPRGDARFELAIVGRNLTDSTQRSATALNKDEVVLPGREIRLMVRALL